MFKRSGESGAIGEAMGGGVEGISNCGICVSTSCSSVMSLTVGEWGLDIS